MYSITGPYEFVKNLSLKVEVLDKLAPLKDNFKSIFLRNRVGPLRLDVYFVDNRIFLVTSDLDDIDYLVSFATELYKETADFQEYYLKLIKDVLRRLPKEKTEKVLEFLNIF